METLPNQPPSIRSHQPTFQKVQIERGAFPNIARPISIFMCMFVFVYSHINHHTTQHTPKFNETLKTQGTIVFNYEQTHARTRYSPFHMCPFECGSEIVLECFLPHPTEKNEPTKRIHTKAFAQRRPHADPRRHRPVWMGFD